MRTLVYFLFAVYPLTIFGVYVGGKYVSPGQIVSAAVAGLALLQLLVLAYRIDRLADRWILGVLLFLFIGVLSIVLSPYGARVVAKGFTQIVGIAIAAGTAFAVRVEVRRAPELFASLMRLASVVLGLLGLIAIVQFAYLNISGGGSLFDFSFMNTLAGGSVWRNPGKIGALYRADSISAEPAHLTRYLGLACGVALVRVGLLGTAFRRSIARVVPLWSSWCVILGYAVSLSLLGYTLLVLVGVACWVVSHRIGAKSLGYAAGYVLLCIGIVSGAAILAGPEFAQKISTIDLILSSDNEDLGESSHKTLEVSALALAVNYDVMKSDLDTNPVLGVGLGGHPLGYEKNAPRYARMIDDIAGLNADDAASLLFRLLSETGIAGMAAYLFMVAYVALKARSAILRAQAICSDCKQPVTTMLGLSVGIAGSLVGVFVIYLARAGQYYELPLWLLMALAICVPQLLGVRYASNPDFPLAK